MRQNQTHHGSKDRTQTDTSHGATARIDAKAKKKKNKAKGPIGQKGQEGNAKNQRKKKITRASLHRNGSHEQNRKKAHKGPRGLTWNHF